MKWSSVTETRYCNYFIRYFLLSSCYWSNVSVCKILGTRRPFPESPETFRAHFGSHNSLCIFKAKESRGRKLCSYFNLYSFYNLWKEQFNRVSVSQFCEWLFGPQKFSGLSRNRPLSTRTYKNFALQTFRWSGDVFWRTGKKNFNAVSHNRARP